nr:immunoglobulin heavy chain junction region [Macaca mulatta]MOW88720.1 immunoglobulin heavy chain junction region [Macaca mulatta]
CVRVQSNFEYW